MTAYIGLLRKEASTDFAVEFPDFPGCVTAGRTLDEASRLAAEALKFHIAGMMEDGLPIPEPSALDDVMADSAYHNAVAVLIDAPTRPARSVRVNVMLPEDLLQNIDRVTNNRSRFLTEAALARLQQAELWQPTK
jgi:predicted RNase H-like HicB family nuclease